MQFDTAKKILDELFENVSNNAEKIEIKLIGGEPLLEFDLIKEIVSYTYSKKQNEKCVFYVVTNGTLLSNEMKEWFTAHKNWIVLVLSLDGARETHNYNRCNSFDKIDIDFFLSNWPNQGVKMTLSEYSLPRLAENIKFLHSCGFKKINGVNLAEGNFDWGREDYIKLLVLQLKELVEFYVENDTLEINQMLGKRLELCEAKDRERKKWCGIGYGHFHYIDGKVYPCDLVNPMAFTENELSEILRTDFSNDDNFIDEDCFENCYIYPICPNCLSTNYLVNKTFKKCDKRRCRVQKLVSLFIADLHTKRIIKNPKTYDVDLLYHTIEAIKKIRLLYFSEFEEYFV